MLNALNYEFTVPTPYMFVNRFLKAVGAFTTKTIKFTAFYMVELALIDYGCIK